MKCAECKTLLPVYPVGHVGGTGYTAWQGKKICYSCSDKREAEYMKDRSRPYVAYLSRDGKTITTWPGGKLGDVVTSTPCKLTRPSLTHSAESYRSIRVRDIHGKEWSGRGSSGICIRLHPVG